MHLAVSDGKRTFTQDGPLPPSFQQETPTVRVRRINPSGILFARSCWPTSIYWPYIPDIGSRRAGHHELVSVPPEPLPDTVLLRITNGTRRFDYYIAPDRDHICLKQTWWQQRNGDWHKDREYTLSDLRQLASGHWWAAREHLQTFDNPQGGTSGYETTFLIDISLLDEGEFPPAAFDGEKLLEEARKLNAEISAF